MSREQLYAAAADAVLVLHFAIVLFVVGAFLLVWLGFFLRWRFVRSLRFRVAHLAAILLVVLQSWGGIACPLTVWENRLRALAGEPVYEEACIQYWVGRVLFYEGEEWAFTLVYTVFLGLVVLSWFVVPPKRRAMRG